MKRQTQKMNRFKASDIRKWGSPPFLNTDDKIFVEILVVQTNKNNRVFYQQHLKG